MRIIKIITKIIGEYGMSEYIPRWNRELNERNEFLEKTRIITIAMAEQEGLFQAKGGNQKLKNRGNRFDSSWMGVIQELVVINFDTYTTMKLNGIKLFGKGNKGNVESMLAVSVTKLDTNVESMLSIASFVRIDATPVKRLDAEVELILLIPSFTRIVTVSV